MAHVRLDQLLEMCRGRVTCADLPVADGFFCYPYQAGYLYLGEARSLTQLQRQETKSVVSKFVATVAHGFALLTESPSVQGSFLPEKTGKEIRY